jgi:hypothetical protein
MNTDISHLPLFCFIPYIKKINALSKRQAQLNHMALFGKIFGGQNQTDKELAAGHSVIVHFTYYKDDLEPLHSIERRLEKEIQEKMSGSMMAMRLLLI